MFLSRSKFFAGIISLLLCSVVFFLAYVAGSRSVGVGADTQNYINLFNAVGRSITLPVERGFLFYMEFVSFLFNDARAMLMITSIFTVTLFCLSAIVMFGFSKIYHVLIFIAISPFFESLLFNVIRQGMGISIAFFGYAIFTKTPLRKKHEIIVIIWKLIFIFVIYNIHSPTALMVAPIYFLRTGKAIKIWVCAVFLSFLSSYYAPFFTPYIPGKYELYASNADSYQTGFRLDFVILSILPIIIFLIAKERYKSDIKVDIFNHYLIVNSIGLMLNFVSYFDRFMIVSWMMIPYIFANIIIGIQKNPLSKERYIALNIVYAYGIAVFAILWIAGV